MGTSRSVVLDLKRATVWVVRHRQTLVASLILSTRKPWAIDLSYFASAVPRAVYLMQMVVAPGWRGRGIGRRCLEQARVIAKRWPAGAIRLDAWDAPAGAGGFYERCGFQEVGRVVYRKAPLVYYELMLPG